jgi:hypothetical protein
MADSEPALQLESCQHAVRKRQNNPGLRVVFFKREQWHTLCEKHVQVFAAPLVEVLSPSMASPANRSRRRQNEKERADHLS